MEEGREERKGREKTSVSIPFVDDAGNTQYKTLWNSESTRFASRSAT